MNNSENKIRSMQRSEIRQAIRTSRKMLTTEEQLDASALLVDKLISHPKTLSAKHVSVTLAYDGEIDLTSFIHWCWQHNKQVYLPVVHPSEIGQLLFLEYTAETEMTQNRYGIEEPKLITTPSDPNQFINVIAAEKLDIVFTPLVAFDLQGNRIGMGGGYYDRLLSPWFQEQKGPYPIGLAHDCQMIKALPIESWDVPLPEIITPHQHFHF